MAGPEFGGSESALVNALTVDVEDYFHAEALAKVTDRSSWDALPSRVEANTDRVLELFAQRQVIGTFFVLGWVAERFPALVRRIADAGHEIGCHGMTHRLVYSQDRDEFADETRRARSLLQDITGQEVAGYRAASFSIVPASLWALEVLAECGFSYDSSIFPVQHDLYGLPGSPKNPYRLRHTASELVELPLTTVTFLGSTLPASGGGYFRLLPWAMATWLLDRANAEDRPFVFYMHPWEIDPGQPRFDVGFRSRFRHYTNLDRFAAKLERLLDRYRFGPMRDRLAALDVASLDALAPEQLRR